MSIIEWFTKGVNLSANIVGVKIIAIWTFRTNIILELLTIWIQRGWIVNFTSGINNLKSRIATQAKSIWWIKCFAKWIYFNASPICWNIVISGAFDAKTTIELRATLHYCCVSRNRASIISKFIACIALSACQFNIIKSFT